MELVGHTYYRIGHDGEWEQIRVTEQPPYRSARRVMEMIAAALDRTKDMDPEEREAELEKVSELIDRM